MDTGTGGWTVDSNRSRDAGDNVSCAGALIRHLKTHSGEKSNKCNQCDSGQYRDAGDNVAAGTNVFHKFHIKE